MKLSDFEDIIDGQFVVFKIDTSGNPNIVHVDLDSCSLRFVFENYVPVYVVHHCLECCWQVGESEIHDCWFKKAISGFECHLLFVALLNTYIVVSPSDIKFCVYMCVAQVLDEISNEQEGVLVTYSDGR